jgi:DNA-3-methyladenine glycosylase
MPKFLPRKFFQRDPLTCARELIGCEVRWGDRAGVIVETEAYDAEGDEASHTHFRPSARAFVAAHREGTAYVYFNYGVHWMLNVLVKGEREGFVLFRALEPVTGLEEMYAARGVKSIHQLCSGPGKLAKALGVTGEHHGIDLCKDPQYAFYPPSVEFQVVAGPRIGITRAVDFPWRFHAEGNPHVSGRGTKKTRPTGYKPDRS